MGLKKSGAHARSARAVLAVATAGWAMLGGLHAAFADEEDNQDRAARWKQLQESIFPHRAVLDSDGPLKVCPVFDRDPGSLQFPDHRALLFNFDSIVRAEIAFDITVDHYFARDYFAAY